MSGTTWTITHNGEPLTWTAVMRLGNQVASDRWQDALAECPLAFDVAEGLSSVGANRLLTWLAEWMPKTASGAPVGVRLVPSIPTADVASMAPGNLAGKPVRI
jgi:hypothetical protein